MIARFSPEAVAREHLLPRDLPPMATKPVKPSSFRAFFTALAQAPKVLVAKAFLALADMAFDTTLPSLFFTSFSFVSPPWVFTLRPEKTEDLARLPLAMTLTFLAFMPM